jgi:hypothetical protein
MFRKKRDKMQCHSRLEVIMRSMYKLLGILLLLFVAMIGSKVQAQFHPDDLVVKGVVVSKSDSIVVVRCVRTDTDTTHGTLYQLLQRPGRLLAFIGAKNDTAEIVYRVNEGIDGKRTNEIHAVMSPVTGTVKEYDPKRILAVMEGEQAIILWPPKEQSFPSKKVGERVEYRVVWISDSAINLGGDRFYGKVISF